MDLKNRCVRLIGPVTAAHPARKSCACIIPLVSTTFTSLNTSFSIKYGSGAAQGVLGRDVVQFAGFEVENQTFGKPIPSDDGC